MTMPPRRRRTIDGYHPDAAAKVAREVTAYGDGTGIVLVPVDLRQFLPGLRTTGQASGNSQTLEVSSVKHLSKTCQSGGGMSK